MEITLDHLLSELLTPGALTLDWSDYKEIRQRLQLMAAMDVDPIVRALARRILRNLNNNGRN